MSGRNKKSSSRPPSAPSPEETRDPELEEGVPGNGSLETATETLPEETPQEEPAQVQLTIKGSDKSARSAARRFGGDGAKPAPAVPQTETTRDADEPEDPVSALLSNGKNMVLVTRQRPRVVQGPDGREHSTNVRIPGSYSCPTSKAEIEELVFQQHGGSKYKCTIHPDTSVGQNQILGHFTIEHSDPKCPPFIDGVTVGLPEPEQEIDATDTLTRGTDHTLRETDPLISLKKDLERRLERARVKKEIEELETQVKEMEGAKNQPFAAPAESDELRKLREDNAKLTAALAEKKVNDRFDKLEGSITELANVIKLGSAVKPTATGEESILLKMMTQSQQHSKEMLALIQDKGKPVHADSNDFDKMLDRMTKLQTLTGGGPNAQRGGGRLSELESKLIDMSFDRMTRGGGGDGDDELPEDMEDAVKLAIKQFAPIAKTYVEKKMDQESAASGGAALSKDQLKSIQIEAAQQAARKVQDDLAHQGLVLQTTPEGRLVALPAPKNAGKPTVPPRSAGTRLVSETRTPGGVVKKVSIQPHNSDRPKPAPAAPPPEPAPVDEKGDSMPKAGVFPMLGPNGETIKIEFPARPGDLKYDRRYAVNFILDGIRSEIRQGLPAKSEADPNIQSYVIGDAIEYLDDEILDQLDNVDSAQKLEEILAPSGEALKIAEIKKSGEAEVVASYLRKLLRSIQREWQREKAQAE